MHHPRLSRIALPIDKIHPIQSGKREYDQPQIATQYQIIYFNEASLGMPIEIVEQSNEATRGIRVDHWYKVKVEDGNRDVVGYLFGPTINPHRIEADFDMDGEIESVYASYNERREMLIHYHNPNGKEPIAWTIIGQFANEHGVSEGASLSVISKEKSGIPLLKIQVDCSTTCNGSVWTKYLSFSNSTIQRALSIEENTVVNQRVNVTFQPNRNGLRVTHHQNKASTSMDYRLVNGVYRHTVKAPLTAKAQDSINPKTQTVKPAIVKQTPHVIDSNRSVHPSLSPKKTTESANVAVKAQEPREIVVRSVDISTEKAKPEVITLPPNEEKPVARITPEKAKP